MHTQTKLQEILEQTVARQVVLVPIKACEGLCRIVERRKEEIGVLKDELYALHEELRQL